MSSFTCFGKMEYYVSRFQLNKICAFVDAQGFSFRKASSDNASHFLPRELTFVGHERTEHLAYNISAREDLLPEEQRRSYKYQTTVVHGLPIDTGIPTDDHAVEKFENDIVRLYDEFRNEGQIYLGVKNQFVARLLKEKNIKFVNFATPFIQLPTAKDLDTTYNCVDLCPLHTHTQKFAIYQCSKRKAEHHFRWIQEKMAPEPGYRLIFDK